MVSLWHSMCAVAERLWFATGAMFGLAILARLDNVFAVAALERARCYARPPTWCRAWTRAVT